VQVGGVKHCLGMDVLDQGAGTMARFVAPVTMLATGGCGQVGGPLTSCRSPSRLVVCKSLRQLCCFTDLPAPRLLLQLSCMHVSRQQVGMPVEVSLLGPRSPQVYPNTTNPGVTTGDGMAIAHRAKAAMANMEFVQFHPTSLFQTGRPAGARSFLISEAVRGEGGLLFNQAGERFMFGWANLSCCCCQPAEHWTPCTLLGSYREPCCIHREPRCPDLSVLPLASEQLGRLTQQLSLS
jgi:FAD binding domain